MGTLWVIIKKKDETITHYHFTYDEFEYLLSKLIINRKLSNK